MLLFLRYCKGSEREKAEKQIKNIKGSCFYLLVAVEIIDAIDNTAV